MSEQNAAPIDENETAVLAVLTELDARWASGDAFGYAALHTPDADYTAFDGTLMRGRAEIATGHAPLFDGIMKGSRLSVNSRRIRFLTSEAAVVTALGGIVMSWQKSRPESSKKRLSATTTVLVRANGSWAIAAFQNTRYRPWAQTLMGRLMSRSAPRGSAQ